MQPNRSQLIVIALATLLLPAPAQKREAPKPTGPLATVAVLGASMSEGFGAGISLAKILDEAIKVPHSKPLNYSSSAFFRQPAKIGKIQVSRALRRKTSLVIGADFLFWYLYGWHGDEKARLASLRQGFTELERFGKSTLAVGNIPDMHGANPKMLPARAIPKVATINAANTLIMTWAKKKGVIVIPLAKWTKEMKEGLILKPDRQIKEPGPALDIKPEQGLQWDGLHPAKAGLLGFTCRLARFLRGKISPFKPGDFHIALARIKEELPQKKKVKTD